MDCSAAPRCRWFANKSSPTPIQHPTTTTEAWLRRKRSTSAVRAEPNTPNGKATAMPVESGTALMRRRCRHRHRASMQPRASCLGSRTTGQGSYRMWSPAMKSVFVSAMKSSTAYWVEELSKVHLSCLAASRESVSPRLSSRRCCVCRSCARSTCRVKKVPDS